MFKNYFKIAWRSIIKNRFYSVVNIIGLSTGIAFTLLIGAYVWSQLQVNMDLKNADRQYIIQSKWKNPNEGYDISTLGQLAKALKDNYPSLVANYYRYDGVTTTISKNNKSFKEEVQIGDSTLLSMYGFKILYGDVHALNSPFKVVIASNKAIKYFGKEDVVGQTISIENFSGEKHDFIITAVIADLPGNTVTQLTDAYPDDVFISEANLTFFGRNMDWQNPHIANYVELQKGVSPAQLNAPIAQLMKENALPFFQQEMKPYLISLHDYYLSANNGVIKKLLFAITAIALFILIMAIINFINMSVSRSAARMREIGIRKVLGGLKKQLIAQFLTESITITFIATCFAFIIYAVTKNLFSSILNFHIPSFTSFPSYFLFYPLLLVIVIGFIAGIYPAFVLSSLKSVESLKGKLSVKENIGLRKSLIAFQFGIATIAFIGAIIISQQINLFIGKDLGYNKDYILSAQLPRNWTKEGVLKMETIRSEFEKMPVVKKASLSFEIPDGNNSGQVGIYKSGSDSASAIAMEVLTTDENYFSLYQIPVVAGNGFEGHQSDSAKIVLNETAVHTLSWQNANDAIGKQIRIPGNPTLFTVKGVTKDFHFGSMQQKIQPLLFFNVEYGLIYRFFSFKINSADVAATIAALQKRWNALMPGEPFEFKFMDDTLAKVYKTEAQLKKASYTAAALALLIVLLGVIGLISISIQKRTKEIGIRKVLGSSVAGVMALFVKEFLVVIVIGGIIACPIAYLIMTHWLQNYAYRINITVEPFVISILMLGFITALLVCMQTSKAALANPVKSLRTE